MRARKKVVSGNESKNFCFDERRADSLRTKVVKRASHENQGVPQRGKKKGGARGKGKGGRLRKKRGTVGSRGGNDVG